MSSSGGTTRRGFLSAAALAALAGVRSARGASAQPPAQPGAQPPVPPAQPTSVPTPPAPPPPPARFFTWREVAPGVWVARPPDGNPILGSSATLLVAKDESILMDTKYAAVGAVLRREAESFGKPIRRVVISHHHTDHTGGNHAFTPDVPVLAHAKAKPRILAQLQRYTDGIDGTIAAATKVPGEPAKAVVGEGETLKAAAAQLKAEQFAPTQTVDADTNLENGGAKIHLRYFGPAHTDNDLAAFLPDANVMHTGDLVANKFHSLLDRPGGGSCQGWIETLGKLQALCDAKTVVIPGHGEAMGPEGLKEQVAYLEALRGLVAEAVKAGRTREEVLKAPAPKAYESFGLPLLLPLTLGALYDELTQK